MYYSGKNWLMFLLIKRIIPSLIFREKLSKEKSRSLGSTLRITRAKLKLWVPSKELKRIDARRGLNTEEKY